MPINLKATDGCYHANLRIRGEDVSEALAGFQLDTTYVS